MTDEIILSTSNEAASIKTVTGWVSRDGRYFGTGDGAERVARYSGCTHRPCEDCGEPALKSYVVCSTCRSKRHRAKYDALPKEEWNGDPICLFDDDRFFFDVDDLIYFCEDNELSPVDLMLTDTRPQGLRRVDEDYWCDDLPEDAEVPDAVYAALETLNKAIEDAGTVCYWMNGKKRIVLPDAVLQEFPADAPWRESSGDTK